MKVKNIYIMILNFNFTVQIIYLVKGSKRTNIYHF
jgi:hypothetical protein